MKHKVLHMRSKDTRSRKIAPKKAPIAQYLKDICKEHGGAVTDGKHAIVDLDIYEVRLK